MMENGVRNFLYWVDHQSRNIIEQSRASSPVHIRGDDMKSRTPKCARCRHHGVISELKGHKYLCRWRNCVCQNCILVKDKQRITASRVAKLRKTRKLFAEGVTFVPTATEKLPSSREYERRLSDGFQKDTDRQSAGSPASSLSSVSSSASSRSSSSGSHSDYLYEPYPTMSSYRERAAIYREERARQKIPVLVRNPCFDCSKCENARFETNLRYLADTFPLCSIKTLGDALRRSNNVIEDALKLMR